MSSERFNMSAYQAALVFSSRKWDNFEAYDIETIEPVQQNVFIIKLKTESSEPVVLPSCGTPLTKEDLTNITTQINHLSEEKH